MGLSCGIKLFPGRTVNTKASEEYVHVNFNYDDPRSSWDGWVPVRRRHKMSAFLCARQWVAELGDVSQFSQCNFHHM